MTDLSLGSDFPKVDESQWRALVEKALKGADLEKTLVARTYDGLTIKPLYTRADEAAANESGTPGHPPFTRGTKTAPGAPVWDVRQLVAEPDPARANALILEDLEGAVTSIALRIAAPGQAGLALNTAQDLTDTLKGVYLDYVTICLDAGPDTARIVPMLEATWQANAIPAEKARAAFNADPLGTLARTGGLGDNLSQAFDTMAGLVRLTIDKYPNATAALASGIPYHEAGASEAQEIACLAATLVAYLRALEERGIAPADALPKIAFALSADADFFLSMAKIRAARTLISEIAKACGAAGAANSAHIAVTTSQRMMAKRDPYVNMLRTTLAAAAAGLAGADAVTVLPYTWPLGLPDRFARRLARNTQLVLQEESSLGQVLDPAGGSWYVEQITTDLTKTAWDLFQQIEAEGGMADALQKGFVQAKIRETADARAKNITLGKDELTGVSAFPHLAEDMIETTPHPLPQPMEDEAITVEPLTPHRLAAPFERLREASDAHKAATGVRPKVFLASLGTLKDFNARATYAQNFFAAGGIEAIVTEGFATAGEAAKAFANSGAKIACLCSSDALYSDLAETAGHALKEAGAAHIYMAGRAGEARDALKAAGISTFIHKGCDMLDVLRAAHDILNIPPAQS